MDTLLHVVFRYMFCLSSPGSGTRVVVLNCQAKYARLILDKAAKLGMLGAGWVWITTDGVNALVSKVAYWIAGLIF